MNTHLECLECFNRYVANVASLRCPACSGLFKLAYRDAPMGDRPRLPEYDSQVSLGEGGTPIVRLDRTASRLGITGLYAKLEFMAPTGSFKDRGSAVLMSAAAAEGVREFIEDSSGNAGASLSAYAAAAGIKAHVFVPASAARGKLDQIRIFGAVLHAIEGPRQAATDAAEKFVVERGLPYLSHNLSPYFSEGMKAVAYELHRSDIGRVDHVVLPVGNGSLLIGAKTGYDELLAAGVIDSAPKFHCVQAEGVQPITAAINGAVWSRADVQPTIATGIAVSVPPRLAQCVDAVRESGGSAVVFADASAKSWQQRLARDEGIFCEVTSAAAFAGLEQLMSAGKIGKNDSVVIPITGSGLKEPLSS
jgi:threonine synthase